jgi:predicted DNA-binding protein (UPF0251 family)
MSHPKKPYQAQLVEMKFKMDISQAIQLALHNTPNQLKAAEYLGVPRPTFLRWLSKYAPGAKLS